MIRSSPAAAAAAPKLRAACASLSTKSSLLKRVDQVVGRISTGHRRAQAFRLVYVTEDRLADAVIGVGVPVMASTE